MVTPYLVGQHVVVDITTTIHLCEGGGCVRCGGCERCGGGVRCGGCGRCGGGVRCGGCEG